MARKKQKRTKPKTAVKKRHSAPTAVEEAVGAPPSQSELESVRREIEQAGIRFLLAQFVDIHGAAKVKMVPAAELDSIVNVGAGFAGAAASGMGQGAHSHDMMARADLASFTPLPWRPEVARFACDIYVDGKPHPYCSRTNLHRVLAELRREGYVFNCGIEPEHFLVQRNPDGSISIWDPAGVEVLDKPCYDFKGLSQAMGYLQEITEGLNKLHWGVLQCDHEDANGQYEINFQHTDALTTADHYTFFKMMASQVALKHGCIATHMAKPFTDQTGSSAHFHFHLADAKTGENLFIDPKDTRQLGSSRLAYHFIGGICKHARALCAVTSPTVNCYKRLQIGQALTGNRSGFTWVPAFITYGDNNRTQMLRCPEPGRFEDRTVSSACNPYLALAAFITAGMDGVRNEIDPGEPNYGENMYELGLEEIERRGVPILPQSLYEALEELRAAPLIQSALGPIYDEFLRMKEAEWKDYHRVVSQWEIDRYLQLF